MQYSRVRFFSTRSITFVLCVQKLSIYIWCWKKECCKQCRYDKMARTKTNTQNNTKHIEHQDATYILKKKTTIFCVFRIFIFLFSVLFIISYMISPRCHLQNKILNIQSYSRAISSISSCYVMYQRQSTACKHICF